MAVIKAILVDAQNQTVTNVAIKNNLKSFYDTIGCNLVEYYNIDEENDFILDEEGNYKENQSFFAYGEYVFAGNVLIAGFDAQTGNTISTTLKLEDVIKNIAFLGSNYDVQANSLEPDIIFID
jgi:hypothetical protein